MKIIENFLFQANNFQLLDDVRNLVAPQDISRYDQLMSRMKTELMTSPGSHQLNSGGRLSHTGSLSDLLTASPSLNFDQLMLLTDGFGPNDVPSFIKPLPTVSTAVPLKPAIKSTSFIKTASPNAATAIPTVAEPISYGPIDVLVPPQPPPQPAVTLSVTPTWPMPDLLQNGSNIWTQSINQPANAMLYHPYMGPSSLPVQPTITGIILV